MQINRERLLRLTFLVEGGLMVVGWILADIFTIPIFDQLDFNIHALLLAILFTLPMLGALVLTEIFSNTIFRGLKDDVELITKRLFSDTTKMDLLAISLLAGLGEEVFFRGFLQTFLTHELGIFTGVVIASLVFGFLHYVSLTYAIYASIIGVYLGIILLVYDNLLIVILAHAFYDFAALWYLTSKFGPDESIPATFPEDTHGDEEQ